MYHQQFSMTNPTYRNILIETKISELMYTRYKIIMSKKYTELFFFGSDKTIEIVDSTQRIIK